MAGSERLRTVGAWSGADVDAGAVQTQLTRLWRSASQSSSSGGPAARTNVLTLVVYADSEATLARVSEDVERLVERHPSRTILVQAEPGAAAPSLDAEVSTRCRLDRPQVCHEQILLRARGSLVEQVASAVSSLLLRDLPTFLWWPDDVQEQPDLLVRLVALCQRLIVDSSRFHDPIAAFQTLLQLPGGDRTGLTDMAWGRLSGWLEVTAQFFDPPAARAYLPALQRVIIDVSGGQQVATDLGATPEQQHGAALPAIGLLYAAWLGSRLGWRPATNGSTENGLLAGTGAGQVGIEFRTDGGKALPPGQLTAVRLEASCDGRNATFLAEREGADQVTTRAEGPDVPAAQRTMRLACFSDAALLSQELGVFDHDRVYEAALQWLGELPVNRRRMMMPTGLDLEVLADPAAVAQAAARLFCELAGEAVAARGRFTVALSGGSTPRALLTLLAQPPVAQQIPWGQTHIFWSDERCVPPDHPDSNYRMAREALLDAVPLPPEQVHRMRGELPVPQQAAREYAEELHAVFGKSALPRFDLLLLGLGEDGHTASIFPDVAVPNDPNVSVAAVYVPKVNMWRLTLTLPVLNAAARVLFLVTGAAKRQPLQALVAGPRSLDLPAQRVLPTNGLLTVLADQAAAGDLGRPG